MSDTPVIESIKPLSLDSITSIKSCKPEDGCITIKVSADKKSVEIYNFYTEDLKDILLSVTNGKDDDMPIHEFTMPAKSLAVISVPVERYTSISNALTLDNIDYRLVRLPAEYEEHKNDKAYSCYEALEKEAEAKAENEKKVQEALEKMKAEEFTKECKEVKKKGFVEKVLPIVISAAFIIAVVIVMIFVK